MLFRFPIFIVFSCRLWGEVIFEQRLVFRSVTGGNRSGHIGAWWLEAVTREIALYGERDNLGLRRCRIFCDRRCGGARAFDGLRYFSLRLDVQVGKHP